MAGTECIELLEKERISKPLKVHLNEWKEIIVLLNSLMTFDQIWFPAITVTCVTSFYLYVWLVNCSILNIIWMIGLSITLLDCIVCGPFQRILPPNSWDQDKEKEYTMISESITNYWEIFMLYTERFFKLRQTNRNLFHSVLTISFFSLLYIGNTFNNLFISYTTVLTILLLPGIKIRSELIENTLQNYIHMIISHLWSIENKPT